MNTAKLQGEKKMGAAAVLERRIDDGDEGKDTHAANRIRKYDWLEVDIEELEAIVAPGEGRKCDGGRLKNSQTFSYQIFCLALALFSCDSASK